MPTNSFSSARFLQNNVRGIKNKTSSLTWIDANDIEKASL